MKKFLPFYLYPNAFKIAGAIIALAGVSLFLFLKDEYQLLLYFGLLVMIYSKEKEESALTESSRNEAFRITFSYIFSLFLLVFIVGLISENIVFPSTSILLIGLPLFFYLVYYKIVLMINLKKDDEKEKGLRVYFGRWLVYIWILIILVCIKFFI